MKIEDVINELMNVTDMTQRFDIEVKLNNGLKSLYIYPKDSEIVFWGPQGRLKINVHLVSDISCDQKRIRK
jgi:hypothetical protein